MLDTTEINKERKPVNQENMVFINGGIFMMGSDKFYPEEKPVHKVTVDAFWMDKCPVTNKAFSDFVSATNYMTVAERPLNPTDFPNVPEENLVPGSMVFEKRNEVCRFEKLCQLVAMDERRQLEASAGTWQHHYWIG